MKLHAKAQTDAGVEVVDDDDDDDDDHTLYYE
jgi:hypothetical protein